ncbi:MAG: CHAT domain-containing protein, partial [Anaerolineae bacterium]
MLSSNAQKSIAIGGDVTGAVLVTGDQNILQFGAQPTPSSLPPAFRALTLVARPLDAEELPDIADVWALTDALRTVEAPVEIRFVRPPTRQRLADLLQREWDIVHFDGHGTAEGGGSLLLEDEMGLRAPLSADDFLALLRRARLPRLLILSACSLAAGEGGGLAGYLAREGPVPAVIGFNRTVSVDETMAFVRPLYAALGAGRTIREAFERAAAALEPGVAVLVGEGADGTLCPSGRQGPPVVEQEPLYGVPAVSESGRFHGVYVPGDPPQGRKGLLAQAARTLLSGEKMLVLTGVGGIGKTALAAALAYRLAWRFPGGVFWADGSLYPDRGLTLDAALDVFAARFGDKFLELPADRKRAMVLELARRTDGAVLWVLDNAEGAEERVWGMARAIPAPSAVLVTTRERPEYGGCTFSVEGMAGGEALYFLLAEMARRSPEAELDKKDLAALGEIAALLDGHALALLHAAALAAEEGPQRALEAVRANPARGETARRFDFSYCRLDENRRRLLHRLAAFAVGFDEVAAEAVCAMPVQAGDTDLIPDWEEGLRELWRKSFLEAHRWGKALRYRLHPVMREYVRGKAGAEMAAHDRRMALHFTELADRAARQLGDPQAARAAVDMAALERANLTAAQDVCIAQGMWREAVELAYDLNNLFERSGHWDLRRRALERGLEAARRAGERRDVA